MKILIVSCFVLLTIAGFHTLAFGEQTKTVSIIGCGNGSCFFPCQTTIVKGSTVTWVNRDSVMHMVVSGSGQRGPDGWFASSYIPQHGTFSHKFDRIGSFVYFDLLHPYTEGVIIVGPSIDSPYVHLQQSFFSDWCRR